MSKIKKILIVEDDKAISDALKIKLGKQGFETKAVYNGEKVLDILEKEKYDLLLLDLIMPKMDGFTTLEKIKEKGLKVKIIVLSNLGQKQDIEIVEKFGVLDYFVKSNISLSEIVERIKKI